MRYLKVNFEENLKDEEKAKLSQIIVQIVAWLNFMIALFNNLSRYFNNFSLILSELLFMECDFI